MVRGGIVQPIHSSSNAASSIGTKQNGFGDQREEVGFREKVREKVPLVPVVGKAAEIERAVLP